MDLLQVAVTYKIERTEREKRVMKNANMGLLKRMTPVLGLVMLVLVGVVRLPAQETVEARLAALEARIQELESELSAARGGQLDSVVLPVSARGSALQGAFIRPAVLTTPGSLEMASASPVAPATAMAPPMQAGTPDFSGDYEGLNFFKGVTFGGFLDAYYSWDVNDPPEDPISFRAFDVHHNSLTFSQADLQMSKAVGDSSPLGYMLDMAVGPTADLVNGGDFGIGNSTAAHFMQYYMSAKAGSATLDFGKFVTPHGAELIDNRGNWNYSRGILFTWAIPFYHFGLRAAVPLGDKATFTGFLVNGWNNVVDNNRGKTGGLSIALNPSDSFSIIQNYMVGQEQPGENFVRNLFDTVATIKLGDKVTFMANYDYGRDRVASGSGGDVHWQGIATYLRLQPSEKFAFTPRFEYYSDPMGFTTGTPQILREITLTPEFTVSDNLVMRFEYRHDWGTEPTFAVNDPSDDAGKQDTLGVGMILSF
jgi:Putative beta-barrel porin-2, OmpL-like. bbp2